MSIRPNTNTKALEDAGFALPKMCENYVKCVTFLKALVKRNEYSLGVSVDNAKGAKSLLKEIGELNE